MEDVYGNQPGGQGPPGAQVSARKEYHIGEWLGKAWRLAIANFWMIVLLGLLLAVANSLVMAPVFCVNLGFQLGAEWLSTEERIGPELIMPASLIWSFLAGILAWALTATLLVQFNVGVFSVLLNSVRTGQFDFSLLGVGFRKWGQCFMLAVWPGVLVLLLPSIPCVGCIALLLLPLYLAGLAWFLFGQVALAEAGATHTGAAARGLELVKIGFWQAVLLMLLGVGLGLAGELACCVGVLFAVPLFWLTVAIGYNELTGGAAASPPTPRPGA